MNEYLKKTTLSDDNKKQIIALLEQAIEKLDTNALKVLVYDISHLMTTEQMLDAIGFDPNANDNTDDVAEEEEIG